jgi:PIN domain nuclease of toxin-antitoxin system
MSKPNRGLLLDTHIWIWFLCGSDQLHRSPALPEVETAVERSNVFLCTISLWETALLAAKGRITLSMDTLDWMKLGLRETGIQLACLSPEVAIESTGLGADFHGDPADRIITATARIHDYALVTRDSRMLTYAQAGHCKFIGA